MSRMYRRAFACVLTAAVGCGSGSTAPEHHAIDVGNYTYQLEIPELFLHYSGTVVIDTTDDAHFTSQWSVPGYPPSILAPWNDAERAYAMDIPLRLGAPDSRSQLPPDLVVLRIRRKSDATIECWGSAGWGATDNDPLHAMYRAIVCSFRKF